MMTINKRFLVCIISTIVIACVDIQGPDMAAVSTADILADLTTGSDAAMLQVGDTLTLSLIAKSVDGDVLDVDLSKSIWKSADPGQVSIDTSGRLIGKVKTVVPVSITVSYTHKMVTRIDTILVTVTEDRIDATSIKLIVLDSNRVGANALFGYPRVRVDLYQEGNIIQQGSKIPIQVPLQIKAIFSPNQGPSGEPVYQITNDNSYLGKFWIKSSVNLFGTQVVDSVEFEGLYPAALRVSATGGLFSVCGQSFCAYSKGFREKVFVQPCALIVVENFVMGDASPIDVIFSDSLNSGDVECGAVDSEVLKSVVSKFGGGTSLGQAITAGNMANMNFFTAGVRRTRTTGFIHIGARDAETKEIYPFEVRYYSVPNNLNTP